MALCINKQKQAIYTSNYGDTYREGKYEGWKYDNTVRQGDWGYGSCTGLWFFGEDFVNLKGRKIIKVVLDINRQQSGYNKPLELKLKMHGYASRPELKPELLPSWNGTIEVENDKTSILITDRKVLNAIQKGTCKGFSIQSEFDKKHYSLFKGICVVTVTYE